MTPVKLIFVLSMNSEKSTGKQTVTSPETEPVRPLSQENCPEKGVPHDTTGFEEVITPVQLNFNIEASVEAEKQTNISNDMNMFCVLDLMITPPKKYI